MSKERDETTSTCPDAVVDDLKAFVDGELGFWRRRKVERHLAICASCRDEADSLRRLAGILKSSAPVSALDPALRARLLDAARSATPDTPARRPSLTRRHWLIAMSAAVPAVAVLVIVAPRLAPNVRFADAEKATDETKTAGTFGVSAREYATSGEDRGNAPGAGGAMAKAAPTIQAPQPGAPQSAGRQPAGPELGAPPQVGAAARPSRSENNRAPAYSLATPHRPLSPGAESAGDGVKKHIPTEDATMQRNVVAPGGANVAPKSRGSWRPSGDKSTAGSPASATGIRTSATLMRTAVVSAGKRALFRADLLRLARILGGRLETPADTRWILRVPASRRETALRRVDATLIAQTGATQNTRSVPASANAIQITIEPL